MFSALSDIVYNLMLSCTNRNIGDQRRLSMPLQIGFSSLPGNIKRIFSEFKINNTF